MDAHDAQMTAEQVRLAAANARVPIEQIDCLVCGTSGADAGVRERLLAPDDVRLPASDGALSAASRARTSRPECPR